MGIFDFAAGLIDPIFGIAKAGWDIFAQNKTWDREDNAVQRRVADLKAAGLSPTLAAGSAASTSSPINIGAPTPAADYMRIKEAASNLLRMKQDISTSNSQEAVNRLQAKSLSLDANVTEALNRMNGEDGQSVINKLAEAKYATIMAGRDAAVAESREAFEKYRKAKVDADEAYRNLEIATRQGLSTHIPGGVLGMAVANEQKLYSMGMQLKQSLQRKAVGR